MLSKKSAGNSKKEKISDIEAEIKSLKEKASASLFLKQIKFTSDYRTFKKGETIDINRKILILVGVNACGKSTILDMLRCEYGIKDRTYFKDNDNNKYGEFLKGEKAPTEIKYFDFHGDDKKFSGAFGEDMMGQLQAMKSSSGFGTLVQFGNQKIKETKNGIIILDEPCRGASPKIQEMFKNLIFNLAFVSENQVIVSTHSERIMDIPFAQIYSVEHKKTFESVEEFLKEHLKK